MISLERVVWAIGQMPTGMKISFIFSLIGIVGLAYFLVISPIIFSYFLIPNIEKRLGKYLEYNPFWGYLFLGNLIMPSHEVALYIVRRYCALIFRGEHGLPEKRNQFALKKAGYTIDMATRSEIIMSVLWAINLAMMIISSIIVLFASGQLSLFAQP